MMNVLHICHTKNNPCSGVVAVVPQHVVQQGKFADTALINLNGIVLPGCEQQIMCDLDSLPEPYDHPDLVVFHEVYKPEFLKAARKFRKIEVPYIIVPHGCLTKRAQQIKWLKKLVANVLLFDPFVRRAKAIQFMSEQEMDNSRFRKKGFVATSGMMMPEDARRETTPDRIRMVYIGRMDIEVKGLDLMLQAVQQTAEVLRASRSTLDLYGPDRLGAHKLLRDMCRELDIEDLVTIHDKILGEEKTNILRSADVFIQTSRTEALTMGILEALSYGVPCIVTEGTTRAQIIQKYDAGWTAQNDVESIARAVLQAVAQRTDWSQKGNNAVRLIAENYAWDKIAEETISQYQIFT